MARKQGATPSTDRAVRLAFTASRRVKTGAHQADIVGSLPWKRTRNVARPPGKSRAGDQAVAGTSDAVRASAPLPVSAQAPIGAMASDAQTGRV